MTASITRGASALVATDGAGSLALPFRRLLLLIELDRKSRIEKNRPSPPTDAVKLFLIHTSVAIETSRITKTRISFTTCKYTTPRSIHHDTTHCNAYNHITTLLHYTSDGQPKEESSFQIPHFTSEFLYTRILHASFFFFCAWLTCLDAFGISLFYAFFCFFFFEPTGSVFGYMISFTDLSISDCII